MTCVLFSTSPDGICFDHIDINTARFQTNLWRIVHTVQFFFFCMEHVLNRLNSFPFLFFLKADKAECKWQGVKFPKKTSIQNGQVNETVEFTRTLSTFGINVDHISSKYINFPHHWCRQYSFLFFSSHLRQTWNSMSSFNLNRSNNYPSRSTTTPKSIVSWYQINLFKDIGALEAARANLLIS
jgi:hypothetical protein